MIAAGNRWPILRRGPFGSGSGWGFLWYQGQPHPELVEGWAIGDGLRNGDNSFTRSCAEMKEGVVRLTRSESSGAVVRAPSPGKTGCGRLWWLVGRVEPSGRHAHRPRRNV